MNRLNYIIIAFAVFIYFYSSCYSQSNKPVFTHYTTDDGLSFNSVYSILQDRQGFIWIGTLDGLDRYDGIHFRNYKVEEDKYFQYVSPLLEDTLGNIWSGSILLRYNPVTDKQQINWVRINDKLEWATGIHSICIGPDNKLYLASADKLYTREIGTRDTVIHEFNPTRSPAEFSRINKLKFDKRNTIWLGTDKGLFYFDPHARQFIQFRPITYPEDKYVHDFLFDNTNKLWIVFTNHVFYYDQGSHTGKEYQIPGIKTPVLNSIYQSSNGVIWVGTTEQGLFYLDRTKDRFECLLEGNTITQLYEDRSGRLWIGTGNAGIFVYDSLQNLFHHLALPLYGRQIQTLAVSKIIPGTNNGLWIGTLGYGLIFYDVDKQNAVVVDDVNNQINMLFCDQSGKIWYDHQKYLVCYNPDNKTFRRIEHPVPLQYPIINYGNSITEMVQFNSKLIISSDYGQVYSLDTEANRYKMIFEKQYHPVRTMQVKQNLLYLGVYGLGIVVLDTTWTVTDTISYNNDEGLIGNAISALYFDSFDTLWAAGYGGLCQYNPSIGQLVNKFTIRSSSNYLTSILEDGRSNLWIGSSKGIYRYERTSQQFVLYSTDHGVPAGRYFINSAAKDEDGMMYFGGNGGIVQFDPKEFRINKQPPPIVLTDLIITALSGRKKEQTVIAGDTAINFRKSIRLKYYQNSFTIKYAALNYTSTSHNRYRYKLEGFDREWHEVGNVTQATFTNLDGGNYRFYLSGSNNDGIWNPEARTLNIHVDQPPWKTGWAVSLYFLMLSGIVLSIFYYYLGRLRLQHQLELQTRESEQLKAIDEAKSRFFAQISHEFRTPLSLIMDPSLQILKSNMPRKKQEKLLSLINKNARRLLSLINQILDLAKLKNSKLKLQAEETDIVAFIKPILSSFTSKADTLKIDYTIVLPDKQIPLWIDREKMEQALVNLLSNAFKFCQQGKVKVSLLEERDVVMIEVSDTGIGIPAGELDKIFEEYYQVEREYFSEIAGTGIGLYLVKEYMELHRGHVKAESEENKGATFTLTLLKGHQHLNYEQIRHDSVSADLLSDIHAPEYQQGETGAATPADSLIQHYTLLIVEDNPDMTEYLAENLSTAYKLQFAGNGRIGLSKTLECGPDLIISDVMMPEMDGFEFSRKLKADDRISHIPVILLSAKNLEVDILKGLSMGAEDYLVKPFRVDELRLRIQNRLDRQSKLRERFLDEFRLRPEKEIKIGMQDLFLEKVLTHLEKHCGNEQFGVEKLSEMMSMSRKHFHHKIKILTGQNPTDLIRNYRLRKAAYLLSQKAESVSEVCYEVGFNNLSYFSKCFYNFFGEYPSEYSKSGEAIE